MGKRAERVLIDGVWHRECVDCHEVYPEQKPHFSTNGVDPKTGELTYKAKCNKCQHDYQQQFRQQRTGALVPVETRIVAVHDGLDVQVGWTGDAKYWPVKPLASLCKRGFTAWNHLFVELKTRADWASRITYVVMRDSLDRQQNMVCLPWEHWAAFWLEFGGDNPQAQSVRTAAQKALASVFGDTAESNQTAAQEINEGRLPPRMRDILSLDLDTLRKHREKVQALFNADAAVDSARLEAEADRERAQQLRTEAERLEREAQERKQAARQAEVAAELRITEAERQQAAIAAELERLLGGDVEYFYVFGRPEEITPMWVSGKYGMTRNLQQRRKQLRSGNAKADFRVKKPCDNGEGCEAETRRYVQAFGTVRGKDEFDLPRIRYDRLIGVLSDQEYIEMAYLGRWVSQEIATDRRAA